jgi:hypothetical protein
MTGRPSHFCLRSQHAAFRSCENPVMSEVWNAIGAVGSAGALLWGMGNGIALWRRQLRDKERDQAQRIYALIQRVGDEIGVRVGNTSDQPVTRVAVFPVLEMDDGKGFTTGEQLQEFTQQTYFRSTPSGALLARLAGVEDDDDVTRKMSRLLRVLPPGEYLIPLGTLSADDELGSVEISFTDGAGRYWCRRAWGELEERDKDAYAHYKIPSPYEYANLSDIPKTPSG